MESAWWRLPGPGRYLELVEEHLRDGTSVLLRHPDNFPASLKDAVERRVADSDRWNWRTLDLGDEDGGEEPVRMLTQRFVVAPNGPPSVPQLMEADSCRDLVLWIDGLERRWWNEWTEFLVDYDRHARNAVAGHLLLCVHLVGDLAADNLPGLASVANCSWRNVVERHDALLFVAGLLRGDPRSGLLRNVRLALCTELAGTDGHLASQLAGAEIETLISPLSFLQDIARTRDLFRCPAAAATWEDGRSEYWDDSWRLNSCLAAAREQTREIRRRVWKAEIGVVFPFIEERRLEIVDVLRPLLKLPLNTEYGVIEEAEDLEIGQLRHCARISGVRGQVRRSLELLADMRHALAHLRPVNAEHLREAASLQSHTAV